MQQGPYSPGFAYVSSTASRGEGEIQEVSDLLIILKTVSASFFIMRYWQLCFCVFPVSGLRLII
jgi:hypothetical protein